MTTVHTSTIQSLPLLARGKVRDNYAVGSDRILMVASDRLSAFDVIMATVCQRQAAALCICSPLRSARKLRVDGYARAPVGNLGTAR